MCRGSGSAGSPRSMWSGTRWCRRSSRPMSDTKNGSRNSRPPEPGPGTRKDRSLKEGALGLFSAAVFVALFYLWGEELLPRSAGRYGQMFPFVGAVALTLAVALFLTEWFGFAGREVRKVRLAARDFLFLCSLALALFFLAKAVMDVLPAGVSSAGGTIPSRVFVYLIPLPAFAMVVRVLLNSEVAILFTVATSVLSAAAAPGRGAALFFPLFVGAAGGAAGGELALHGESGIVWAGIFGAMNGIVAGPIALAILPVAEYAFGYTSDIRLMELANTSHPLLRRLMIE